MGNKVINCRAGLAGNGEVNSDAIFSNKIPDEEYLGNI